MANAGSISDRLMQELRFGGLDKGQLADLVKVLDDIHQQGFSIKRVLTKGIPPIVDSVEAHSVLTREGLATLVRMLETNTRIRSVVVFPLGIPAPEEFQAEITVQ